MYIGRSTVRRLLRIAAAEESNLDHTLTRGRNSRCSGTAYTQPPPADSLDTGLSRHTHHSGTHPINLGDFEGILSRRTTPFTSMSRPSESVGGPKTILHHTYKSASPCKLEYIKDAGASQEIQIWHYPFVRVRRAAWCCIIQLLRVLSNLVVLISLLWSDGLFSGLR